MKYSESFLQNAHGYAFRNRRLLNVSDTCACFYCLNTFKPSTILEWIDSKNPDTAMCPICGIDAIIGDKSGMPIDDIEFLKQMQSIYFSFLI